MQLLIIIYKQYDLTTNIIIYIFNGINAHYRQTWGI